MNGKAPLAGGSAADLIPSAASLPKLRAAAAHCQGCALYRNATQTVFGEGTRRAEVVMVGEQPGDRRTCPADPSSDRPGASWTKRWTRRGSTGTRST